MELIIYVVFNLAKPLRGVPFKELIRLQVFSLGIWRIGSSLNS